MGGSDGVGDLLSLGELGAALPPVTAPPAADVATPPPVEVAPTSQPAGNAAGAENEDEDSDDDHDREVLVELDNVHKTYLLGVEGVPALRGVSLKIFKGEWVVVYGTSGGGKTTLLNIIGTIDKPTKGEVTGPGLEKARARRPRPLTGRNGRVEWPATPRRGGPAHHWRVSREPEHQGRRAGGDPPQHARLCLPSIQLATVHDGARKRRAADHPQGRKIRYGPARSQAKRAAVQFSC